MTKIVKLNLARNCIKYIIKTYGITKIYVPFYTCPVVWNTIREMNCEIKFYHINENFMPINDFNTDDYILYTNYFGLCYKNCEILAKKYKNLIIDNSQSFYSEPLGLANFNSLRKFFNVQNGAYLYISKTNSSKYNLDNISLKNVSMQENYEQFVQNELTLNNQKEIKIISPNVEHLMSKINFEQDKKTRFEIFKKYSSKFNQYNKIKLEISNEDAPYCYPFSPININILNEFEQNNLIILRLWQPIHKSFPEYKFLENTVALPLSQYAEKILY